MDNLCTKCNKRKLAYKGATLCRRCYDERPDKRAYFKGTLQERLAHYTDRSNPDGCWLWTGTQDSHGYGLVWDVDAAANRYAHVVAWELDRGLSINPDQVVRHYVCDTPLCVRPDHLLSGTHADNVADKVAHERQARGQSHGIAKLTEEQVVKIRQLYSTGSWSQHRLGASFGVSQPTISLIVTRKEWAHLP